MGPRAWAGPDHDVQLIVLERGIELLFHDGLQPMDLVEEQHLPGLQVRQDRSHIALHLQRRSAGLLETYAELLGDDGRQRRLAEPRRPEKQYMVQSFATGLRSCESNRQLLLGLGLPYEFGEALRPQLQFDGVVVLCPAS